MFQIARLNITKLTAFQTRSFTVASVLALKSAAVKTTKTVSPELKLLQTNLKKERALLEKLQVKIKKVSENEKSKKLEAAKKKLEHRALRPYKKLSGLNIYVKEHHKSIGTLAESSKKWAKLSESEKAPYLAKAQKINDENLKIYVPKPTRPAPAFARFTKAIWQPTDTFGEASKIASGKWKGLTTQEKQKYNPSQEEWDAYKKAFDSWRDGRLKLASTK